MAYKECKIKKTKKVKFEEFESEGKPFKGFRFHGGGVDDGVLGVLAEI